VYGFLKNGFVMKKEKAGIQLVVSLCVLLASLGTSIANIALPVFEGAFSATFQSVQWVTISYLLATTVSVMIAGKLADQSGHTRILRIGILLFTTASLLCAVASTIPVLILLRAVQGIGAAVLMTVGITISKKHSEALKIGSAMGLIGTMSAVGTALGPSVGGQLLSVWDWPSIFLLLFFLGVLAFGLSLRYLPEDKPTTQKTGRIHLPSVLALVLSIAAYALSLTLGRKYAGPGTGFLILVCLLSGGLFFYLQKRSSSPLIDIGILKNGMLRNALLANFLVSNLMMTTLIVGPFFLTIGLKLDKASVGWVMSIGPLISILTGIPAGKFVDKKGSGSIIKTGLLCLLAGAITLAILPTVWGVTGYLIGIAIVTPGYQLFQAGNNTAVMASTGNRQDGVISGMLNLSRNLGLITGASIMGALFSAAVATEPVRLAKPENILFGASVTFGAAAVLVGSVGIKSYRKSGSGE
jgi:MFS family permease